MSGLLILRQGSSKIDTSVHNNETHLHNKIQFMTGSFIHKTI